MIMIIKRQF